MVDITEISAIVAATGVLVGVAYYILDMRHQTRLRETDVTLRLDAIWESKDFIEWWLIFRERDPKEYDTWVRGDIRKWVAEWQIGGFFNTLGFLLFKKLVDLEFACNLFNPIPSWEKMRVLVEKVRKEGNDAHFNEWYEYLYNRAKNRRQRLEAKGIIRSAPLQ